MDNDGTINSLITDSVTQTNTTVLGQAPAGSQGLLDVAMAETVGIGMYNAVSAQHYSQMVNGATVVATCARLLRPFQQASGPQPPPPPPPISPLQPVVPPSDPTAAMRDAQAAENRLLTELDSAVQGNQQMLDKVKAIFDRLSGGSSTSSSTTTNDDESSAKPAAGDS